MRHELCTLEFFSILYIVGSRVFYIKLEHFSGLSTDVHRRNETESVHFVSEIGQHGEVSKPVISKICVLRHVHLRAAALKINKRKSIQYVQRDLLISRFYHYNRCITATDIWPYMGVYGSIIWESSWCDRSFFFTAQQTVFRCVFQL